MTAILQIMAIGDKKPKPKYPKVVGGKRPAVGGKPIRPIQPGKPKRPSIRKSRYTYNFSKTTYVNLRNQSVLYDIGFKPIIVLKFVEGKPEKRLY